MVGAVSVSQTASTRNKYALSALSYFVINSKKLIKNNLRMIEGETGCPKIFLNLSENLVRM